MSVEDNKKIATKYHDLKPEDMDEVLAPDFKGEHVNGFSWDLERHKETWSKNTANDVIHEQFGEGELVCTRFTRSVTLDGKPLKIDGMHLKRFKDGKIAHIWEYYDGKQIDEQKGN